SGEHQLENPTAFTANDMQEFLVTDGRAVHFIQEGAVTWKGQVSGKAIIQLAGNPNDSTRFFLLTPGALYRLTATTHGLDKILEGEDLTSFDVDVRRNQLVVGTSDGYFRCDMEQGKVAGEVSRELPWTAISTVKVIDGNPWF